jgi:lipoyl(octanoyl) transferase
MKVIARKFGMLGYAEALHQMREFVDRRNEDTLDELWCLEHPPVFTQGQGGRAAHVGDVGPIPVVQSDRGGQVTYHGPGQLIVYILMDLRRQAIGPRELVFRIEAGLLDLLIENGIDAERRPGAPGIYVAEAKIAALGLRIRRGTSYHGLSLNVDLDLEPFSRINPCGFKGLEVTRLKDFDLNIDCDRAAKQLLPKLVRSLYGGNLEVELDYQSGNILQLNVADSADDDSSTCSISN